MNLKEETLKELARCGKTWDDVVFVSLQGEEYPKDAFLEAADIEYDNDYGAAEIDESLYIVGDTWWLNRSEYDGKEWWSYNEKPARPDTVGVSPLWYTHSYTMAAQSAKEKAAQGKEPSTAE